MATVNFNLRGKLLDKPQPIYLIFRHKNIKLTYSTGFKVLPKFWNQDKQQVKNVTAVTNKVEINNFINDVGAECMRFASKLIQQKRTISKDILKEHLDFYTKRKRNVGENLMTFIESYIEDKLTNINPYTGKMTHERTIKKWGTTFNLLKRFDNQYYRKVDFESIDKEFGEDYHNYLVRTMDYAQNTVEKHISVFIYFMNAATEAGHNDNLVYKKFRIKREKSDSIALTEPEILKIFELDLSRHPRYEETRDLFIVAAWTGLRYSDFSQLKPSNIRNGSFHVKQYKTGEKVVIPFHWMVQGILKKYKNHLPKGVSNAMMNKHLKEICKMAGLNAKLNIGITKGGTKIFNTYEQWELCTTHTGRRSFATNMAESGFPHPLIMKITGHKSEKTFLNYIKTSKERTAKKLREHWEKLYKEQGLRVAK